MLISIQYIRAIAAILVLIVHTFGWGGAQGVDIFFVISGFIMMYIMNQSHRGALEFFFSRFYRVAPIYYIATALALIIGLTNDPTLEHIIHSVLFLKIKWSSPVLSIGWTLEYEFIFYILCAFSLTFALKTKYRTAIIIFSLLGLSFLLDFIMFPEKAYGHFIEFIFGILGYYLISDIKDKNISINKYILTTLLLSSFAGLFYVQEVVYPSGKLYFRFLGYGVLSLIFVVSFILLEKHLPKYKSLKTLGDASYSIYITHTITLHSYYFAFNVERYHSFFSDLASLMFALLVGLLVHLYIEKPIGKKLSAKKTADYLLNLPLFTYIPNKWLQRAQ